MPYCDHPDYEATLHLALELADTARAIARRDFRTGLAVERKGDGTPVTRADREIEEAMRARIRQAFPRHGIRGEEYAPVAGDEFTWVLDPIDGTKSFVTGFPLFGSLIALLHHGRPVLGIIEAPGTGDRWIGSEGRMTVCNGGAAEPSSCVRLAEATIYTTTPETFTPDELAAYGRVSAACNLRRYGGDCYIYGLVASGHCELAIEARLKPHDYMALVPVVEGAGGRISDWQGRPLDLDSDGRVVAAANEAVWREALRLLA